MTQDKWNDPHDKFLDALAFIRIASAEEADLNESEHFALLLEDTTLMDRAKMIAALASFAGLLIKEYVIPGIDEEKLTASGLSEQELVNTFLDTWIGGVVSADFDKDRA